MADLHNDVTYEGWAWVKLRQLAIENVWGIPNAVLKKGGWVGACVRACACVQERSDLLTVMRGLFSQPSVQAPPGSDYHREWMAYRDKLKTALDCFQVSDIQACCLQDLVEI